MNIAVSSTVPILYGVGTGPYVMSPIAAPRVGGMVGAVALTLLVLPVTYYLARQGTIKMEKWRGPTGTRLSAHE